ncbi:class I SAM-dependent methyltransferase [Patescibacteria group bacterium]|nr:class I SAM-dependent methyltransferase [Patescibacteria group bacterium]
MELVILAVILILVLIALGLLTNVFFSFLTMSLFGGAYFAGTSRERLKQVFKLANLKLVDKLLDLGSGDGRIVSAAAQAWVKATGVEINPYYVWLSRQRIKHLKLTQKAKIVRIDLWQFDTSPYSVVVVYGIGYMMERLKKKLERELKPGSRIISVYFPIPGWQAVKELGDVKLYIIE